MNLRLIITTIGLLNFGVIHAQIQHDTSEVKAKDWPIYTKVKTVLYMDTAALAVDTGISGIERLHPVVDAMNPLFDLGQLASPTKTYNIASHSMGFIGPTESHMGVWLYEEEAPVAKTTSPLTRLAYSQGGGDLIYLTASHQRNVFERWNTQLDYRRVKNNNLYFSNVGAPETTKINDLYNLRWSNRFHTLNHKYEVMTALRWNQVSRVETAGLENLNRFQVLEGRDKEANNPAILSAANSFYRSSALDVIQFYRPGRQQPDSVMRANPPSRAGLDQQFYHRSTLERKRMRFVSNAIDTPFLNYPGFNQTETKDSFTHSRWFNQLGYVLKEKQAISQLFVDADAILLRTIYGTDQTYLNTSFGGMRTQKLFGMTLKAKVQYFLSGYNVGDLKIQNKLSGNWRKFRVEGWVKFLRTEPSYKAQHFVGNNLFWNQELEKEIRLPIGVKWHTTTKGNWMEWSGKLQHVFLQNYTYFQLKEAPVQEAGMSTQRGSTKVTINTNHFNWQQSVELNRWNSKDNVLGLPPWFSQTRLAYKALLFEKNLVFEVGANVSVFGSFYANRFDPVSREFVVQTETELPTYPVVDLFINGKVKTMRFFLSMTHVNEDLLSEGYYGSPYYPGINRTLRIGIFWDLFY